MVFLRYKIVKGEKYFYLVKSVWDSKHNTSRQETIKYLGKLSEFTKNDIPAEYRNDPKIISFLASDEMLPVKEKEDLLLKLKGHLYKHLIIGDHDKVAKIYDDYSSTFGFVSFFEEILAPVMYHIGDLWKKNEISVADEHIASNVANMLVKTIQERTARPPTRCKVVICVPEGEQHNLGANIIEAHLSSLGFTVYNLTPSEPHSSIVGFIKNKNPDVVLVSVTLKDMIKSAHRLVNKISQMSNVPIFVGGQALDENEKFETAHTMLDNLKNLPKEIKSARSRKRR